MGLPDQELTDHKLQQGEKALQNHSMVPRCHSKTKMLQRAGLWLLNFLLRLRFCINYSVLLVQGQHLPKPNYQFKGGLATSDLQVYNSKGNMQKPLKITHSKNLTVEVT